jgi:hypothetical protein
MICIVHKVTLSLQEMKQSIEREQRQLKAQPDSNKLKRKTNLNSCCLLAGGEELLGGQSLGAVSVGCLRTT